MPKRRGRKQRQDTLMFENSQVTASTPQSGSKAKQSEEENCSMSLEEELDVLREEEQRLKLEAEVIAARKRVQDLKVSNNAAKSKESSQPDVSAGTNAGKRPISQTSREDVGKATLTDRVATNMKSLRELAKVDEALQTALSQAERKAEFWYTDLQLEPDGDKQAETAGRQNKKSLRFLTRKDRAKYVGFWPHMFARPRAHGKSGVEVKYDDMTFTEFVEGYVTGLDAKILGEENHARAMSHLKTLMRDASVYPWESVRDFFGAFMMEFESGSRTWSNANDMDLREQYLYTSLARAGSQTDEKAAERKRRGDRDMKDTNYCYAFQKKECQKSAQECKFGHFCSECYRKKKQKIQHARAECPLIVEQQTSLKVQRSDISVVTQTDITCDENSNFINADLERADCGCHCDVGCACGMVQGILCDVNGNIVHDSIQIKSDLVIPGDESKIISQFKSEQPAIPLGESNVGAISEQVDETVAVAGDEFCAMCDSEGCACNTMVSECHRDVWNNMLNQDLDKPECDDSLFKFEHNMDKCDSVPAHYGVSVLLPDVDYDMPEVPIGWPSVKRVDASYIQLHNDVYGSGLPNALGCKIPVTTGLHIPAWESRLQDYKDPEVASFLKYGWPISYLKDQLPCVPPTNHPSAYLYAAHVDRYVEKELVEGAMMGPFSNNPLNVPLIISPLQTVEKRGSSNRRVVVDLSYPSGTSVNDGIPKGQFLGEEYVLEYPSIDALVDLIKEKGQGCLLYKVDLRRAYRQLPVDPHDYHLLGVSWRDQVFIDTALPNGLRTASTACQRTTNAVKYMHKQDGHDAVNYVDDFCGCELPDVAQTAFDDFFGLLGELGLEVSHEKTVPPTTCLTFLGTMVDTVQLTLSIPPDKLEEVRSELLRWKNVKSVTKRQLQSLLGKLFWISRCVRPGRTFLSRMLDTLRRLKYNYSRTRLSTEFRLDLAWWQNFMETYNGVSMMPLQEWTEPDGVLATDACLGGCGGVCEEEFFHTEFPTVVIQMGLDINQLELMAILVAARLWAPKLVGRRLLVYSDNKPSVSVLNSGRSKDKILNKCLRELWLLAATYEFEIKALHIRGTENRLPDYLSRWHMGQVYETSFWQSVETRDMVERVVADDFFCFTDSL